MLFVLVRKIDCKTAPLKKYEKSLIKSRQINLLRIEQDKN